MSDLLCLHVQQQQQQQRGRVRRRSASERLRSGEADSRRGDEKQTLSAACREPAIFHFRLVFRAAASADNLLHLQAPWCADALIQAAEVRGGDGPERAGTDAGDDKKTYLCNFPPPLPAALLYQRSFSPAAAPKMAF